MRPDEETTGTEPTGADPVGEAPLEPAQAVDGDVDATELAAEEVEHDLEALKDRAGKADEYLDMARRAQADFENFRKRASRDAAAAEERGVGRLARELVSALDNLEHALAAIAALPEGDPAHDVARGFSLVRDELLAGFDRAGVTIEQPLGEAFDPERHEAIAQVQEDGAKPGEVVVVHQAGYMLGSTVLRAARVSVAG